MITRAWNGFQDRLIKVQSLQARPTIHIIVLQSFTVNLSLLTPVLIHGDKKFTLILIARFTTVMEIV
jgi:hypothetical protein